jgi:hypothetical protein
MELQVANRANSHARLKGRLRITAPRGKLSPPFTVTVMFTGAFVISCTSLGRQVLEFSILI